MTVAWLLVCISETANLLGFSSQNHLDERDHPTYQHRDQKPASVIECEALEQMAHSISTFLKSPLIQTKFWNIDILFRKTFLF